LPAEARPTGGDGGGGGGGRGALRALRVGVGGPVGTGKSSLIAALCRGLAGELELGVVTNDIYTTEDARFLREQGVLPVERIEAVQTGCCPHTAIRDDISMNLLAVEELERAEGPLDVVFVESGGDNLTACFSPALADTQIFVLDCAGGDDVPRKGGPGVARSDLLVINKVDLAPYVGADVGLMLGDAALRRGERPTLAVSLRDPESVVALCGWVRRALETWQAGTLVSVDPGPPAPHAHGDVDPGPPDPHAHAHADTHAPDPSG
jgi:urease accessory protein